MDSSPLTSDTLNDQDFFTQAYTQARNGYDPEAHASIASNADDFAAIYAKNALKRRRKTNNDLLKRTQMGASSEMPGDIPLGTDPVRRVGPYVQGSGATIG